MIQIHNGSVIQTSLNDFPVLAVNVLDRLGYHVTRASKQLDQILAVERLDEQIGQDWWRHEYRIVMRWSVAGPPADDFVHVSVDLEERKGGASEEECKKRLDTIFVELAGDAKRLAAAKVHKPKSTVYGSAQWGTVGDLEKKGYLLKAPDAKRLIIGRDPDNKYIQVPEFWTHAHALVCGRTGVGKSRGFFIPQLVERIATNMIVTESTPGYETGELYKLTAGWRKMAGHKIYSFNASDLTSHRINPIDRVRRAREEDKVNVAEKIADLVIMNGEFLEAKGELTWNRSEKLLLTPLILHAAACDPKYGHFGAIRWMLLKGPDRLAKILEKSPSRVAQMEFEGWLRLSGETNFKYGVFSGLITKLNPWMTDHMVALTETTDIDLDALANELFTFYLAVPSRSRDMKLIGALMVNFLLDHILEIRERMKYPVAMLLDEFTNFGKISGIGDTLSLIRKNKIGLVLGFQNYFQLEQVYSRNEAQVIMDQPATQVFFKQKTYREARELSEAIGRTTVEETSVGDSGRVNETIHGRNLITPDELISLNQEVIVFTADAKPLKLPLISPTMYEQAMQYEPPLRKRNEISQFVISRGLEAEEGVRQFQGYQNEPRAKKASAKKKEQPQASPPEEKSEASAAVVSDAPEELSVAEEMQEPESPAPVEEKPEGTAGEADQESDPDRAPDYD